MTPFTKKDELRGNMDLPCGKCPACLKRRTSSWSFRLMQEFKIAESAYFVTLTYNTEHVPISKRGFMTLQKRDVQLYFKRLRKLHPKNHPKIKYYIVGEYGSKTKRPHYHMLLFNAIQEHISSAWTIDGREIGSFHFGEVNEASVGYTLKYMSKPKTIPMHQNDDRVPEFSLMSKGLGASYLTNAVVRWHKQNLRERMHLNSNDGKKIAMPRYYKDKIYSTEEKDAIAYHMKQRSLEIVEKAEYDYYNNNPNADYQSFRAYQMEQNTAAFKRMHEKSLKNRSKI